MKKYLLQIVKAALPSLAGCMIIVSFGSPLIAQQNIIAVKDNTRPGLRASINEPALVSFLIAKRWNGYNEIEWTTLSPRDTRKFIVEYSSDGYNFQTAGEILSDRNNYTLQHRTLDQRPLLYRVKTEQLNGKFSYTKAVMLDGVPVSPVKIYPTVISGNTVSINSQWPVERITVVSLAGAQVFTKEMSGQRDYISVVIPNLAQGQYRMVFTGKDWRATESFVVGK